MMRASVTRSYRLGARTVTVTVAVKHDAVAPPPVDAARVSRFYDDNVLRVPTDAELDTWLMPVFRRERQRAAEHTRETLMDALRFVNNRFRLAALEIAP